MVDVPTISAIVAAARVVVGVAVALLEIRHLAKARGTDILMRIYEGFGNRDIFEVLTRVGNAKFESFEDYRTKHDLIDVGQLAVFFEGIGTLLEQDLIDVKLVDSLFGPTLQSAWEPMRPVICSMREEIHQPFLFSHYEYLVNRLAVYREELKKKQRCWLSERGRVRPQTDS